MANVKEIIALASSEKIFFEDNYYRFRKVDEKNYQVARLVLGKCGDFYYHPQISLKLVKSMFVATDYFDNFVTPIKTLKREDDPTFLDQEFQNVLTAFLEAKNQEE